MGPRMGSAWIQRGVYWLFGVSTVLFGVLSVQSALAERSSSSAARDLQVAAMHVATADAVRIAGGDPSIEGIDAAVAELSGSHDEALAALSDADADATRALLVEIAVCGTWLLDPEGEPHPVHEHGDLQALLDKAATTSELNAEAAEERALLAFLAIIAVSLSALIGLTRSWARNRNHQLAVRSEENAGRRLAALISDSTDAFLVIGEDGHINYRSESAAQLLSDELDHLEDLVARAAEGSRTRLRRHLRSSTEAASKEVFELSLADGTSAPFELRVSDLSADPAVAGHVVTARNISHEHIMREELHRQARTDAVTGVSNRRMLPSLLAEVSATLSDTGKSAAFVLLDIDAFRATNDALGHRAGDELLRLAATRIRRALGSDASLVRLGSDEFATAVNVASSEEAHACAASMRRAFAEPFRISGRPESLSVSIGIAIVDQPQDVESLHGRAESALIVAKRGGTGRTHTYEAALEASISRSAQVRRAMYSAVYDNEFELDYQPIVFSSTGAVESLEALLRWNSPTLGAVTPDEFIPIAEAAGDICAIGRWVAEGVCRQLVVWTAEGANPDLTISLNVSPRQLAEPEFVSSILRTATAWEVDPNRLTIEVTETAALDEHGTAIARLEQLRAVGFKISIDDFGSGYSNLGQLLRVPFDVLKIDRSLLMMLSEMRASSGGDPTGPCEILGAIVSIADILGVPVVCEGVETDDQRRSLAASGITYLQGYFTGRPAAAGVTTELLDRASADYCTRVITPT